MSNDLGCRMKGYEYVSRNYLTRRVPVIIRLDGKAFHSFTKGMKRPFDNILMSTMWETAKYLCENIQGVKIAYTQSDEITLLLTDFETIDTQPWFEYNVQKMTSVSASMATLAFNAAFRRRIIELQQLSTIHAIWDDESEEYLSNIEKKVDKALFDSRVFSIPKDEVCNCFIWRQQDATRNSIQMVGQANFSHKELHGKSCKDIQEMLFSKRGINWDSLSPSQKRGICIIKEKYFTGEDNNIERNRWVTDVCIPIFSKDRDYIEKYL